MVNKMGNRFQKNTELTAKVFQDALISVWNEKKCYITEITVRDICAAAGSSRTSFYNYYNDKFDLLEDIENMLLDVHMKTFESFLGFEISSYRKGEPFPCIYEMNVHVREMEPYYRALFGPYGVHSFIYKTKNVVKMLVKRKLDHDGIVLKDSVFNLELIASAVVCARQYWLFTNPSLSPLEVSSMIGNYIFGRLYDLRDC